MTPHAPASAPPAGHPPRPVPDARTEQAARTERERVAAVRRYDLTGTPPEGAFDRVAMLAARLLDAPAATVTIVDADRVRFLAAHGWEGTREFGRDPGLCDAAVLRDGPLIVPDTLLDPVASGHPLVTGEPGVRFYAAAPITTGDGHRLGTVDVFDTRPRAVTADDTAALTDLAALVMDQLEARLSALRALRDEQERRERAEKDRAAVAAFASTLQRTLLPPALPAVPGLELACHYRTASAHEVGGDFYDVFPLDGGRWAFFMGDVCGKGPEAATVTALARHTLRAAARIDPDPVTVLGALNTELLTDVTAGSRFCTTVYGVLAPREPAGFTVTVAAGGHPPPYHLAADGDGALSARPVRTEGGMLVGAFPQARFARTTFTLDRGEALFLYTDGLIEARTAEGAMLGDEGLTGFLHRRTGVPTAANLVEDAIALLTSLPDQAGDDVALLALSVPGPRAAPETGVSATARTTARSERLGQE